MTVLEFEPGQLGKKNKYMHLDCKGRKKYIYVNFSVTWPDISKILRNSNTQSKTTNQTIQKHKWV